MLADFAATYNGLVNSDTPSALRGSLTFATDATDASPVGSYLVTPGGLMNDSYSSRPATTRIPDPS